MKNRKVTMLFFAGMLALSPNPANAQIGNLLKKVGKVVGTNENGGEKQQAPSGSTDKTITMADGATLKNPVPDVADIQLVSVCGKPKSENFGDVYVVLKIKALKNINEVSLGGNINFPLMLVDDDGNNIEAPLGWYSYDVTEGLFVKVPVEKTVFPNVPRKLTTIQHLQLGIVAGGSRGLIVIKNVPIQWEEAEK